MQTDNEKMLQEIVQNTEMGKNTLDELMSLTHDQSIGASTRRPTPHWMPSGPRPRARALPPA